MTERKGMRAGFTAYYNSTAADMRALGPVAGAVGARLKAHEAARPAAHSARACWSGKRAHVCVLAPPSIPLPPGIFDGRERTASGSLPLTVNRSSNHN